MKALTLETKSTRNPGYPVASDRFEGAVVFGSLWILAGLFLDGWSHNNIPETINSFLNPWHAILYSGYAVSAAVLGVTYIRNVKKGYGWLQGLLSEYMLSLLGAAIFAAAGNLDFIWHELFGFEENVEALVSPSHLILAVGGVMMMSGPLRAAWNRSNSEAEQMPRRALLSLFAVLAVFTFFTHFSNAFAFPQLFVAERPAGDTYLSDVTLISYVLIPTVLFMSALLLGLRRWKLPVGSLTLLLTGTSTLIFLMTWRYSHEQWPVLIAALVGGILADVLLITLKPSATNIKALRRFSFLVPSLSFLAYFLSLILTQGIWWNSNMWLGMIFFSGVTGLGLSWLVVPPYSNPIEA